jgi:hypothetical protein
MRNEKVDEKFLLFTMQRCSYVVNDGPADNKASDTYSLNLNYFRN